jgi:hypothetical protein
MLIDPTTEAYLQTVLKTHRWIAFHNAVVVMSTSAALATAAIHDSWLVALVALFILGAVKPFVVIPGTIRLVDPKNLRRVN